jgi:hypothetical protein
MEPAASPWSYNPVDDLGVEVEELGPLSRSRRVRTLPGDRMRSGARTLRWCALLLALMTATGQTLVMYASDDFSGYGSGWATFGQLLTSLSWSLGMASIVFAISFLVGGYAARLDLDRALAERE